MHDSNLIAFFALFFSGMLAGFEVAIHYGVGAPPASLREDAQLLLSQAMVRRLRILAPILFLPSLLMANPPCCPRTARTTIMAALYKFGSPAAVGDH